MAPSGSYPELDILNPQRWPNARVTLDQDDLDFVASRCSLRRLQVPHQPAVFIDVSRVAGILGRLVSDRGWTQNQTIEGDGDLIASGREMGELDQQLNAAGLGRVVVGGDME